MCQVTLAVPASKSSVLDVFSYDSSTNRFRGIHEGGMKITMDVPFARCGKGTPRETKARKLLLSLQPQRAKAPGARYEYFYVNKVYNHILQPRFSSGSITYYIHVRDISPNSTARRAQPAAAIPPSRQAQEGRFRLAIFSILNGPGLEIVLGSAEASVKGAIKGEEPHGQRPGSPSDGGSVSYFTLRAVAGCDIGYGQCKHADGGRAKLSPGGSSFFPSGSPLGRPEKLYSSWPALFLPQRPPG
ncbi:hypothetical protein KM043_012840 [Ampulex compressa]|nr:hypothetical protein KM043_012840 [Ampulex compressa]